jgi:hypothetical protein
VDPDPDPVFQVNPVTNQDTDPTRIQGFDDQKLQKKIQLDIFLCLLLIKNCNLVMSKATGKAFSPQKRTSSQPARDPIESGSNPDTDPDGTFPSPAQRTGSVGWKSAQPARVVRPSNM